MLKQLLLDSTDFTEAIFKMPQISKHFSAMLYSRCFQCTVIEVLISLEYYRLENRYRIDRVHCIDQCTLQYCIRLLLATHGTVYPAYLRCTLVWYQCAPEYMQRLFIG